MKDIYIAHLQNLFSLYDYNTLNKIVSDITIENTNYNEIYLEQNLKIIYSKKKNIPDGTKHIVFQNHFYIDLVLPNSVIAFTFDYTKNNYKEINNNKISNSILLNKNIKHFVFGKKCNIKHISIPNHIKTLSYYDCLDQSPTLYFINIIKINNELLLVL